MAKTPDNKTVPQEPKSDLDNGWLAVARLCQAAARGDEDAQKGLEIVRAMQESAGDAIEAELAKTRELLKQMGSR